MAQPCQPSSIQFSVAACELGIQEGFSGHIGGIAVDDQFVYAKPRTSGKTQPHLADKQKEE